MKPHQLRVIEEKNELDQKLNALLIFMDGEVFQSLSAIDQSLLVIQSNLMASYSTVLKSRIDLF